MNTLSSTFHQKLTTRLAIAAMLFLPVVAGATLAKADSSDLVSSLPAQIPEILTGGKKPSKAAAKPAPAKKEAKAEDKKPEAKKADTKADAKPAATAKAETKKAPAKKPAAKKPAAKKPAAKK